MNKKCNVKRATVGSSQEIWCSDRETRRFHEKLGDSWENWELAGMKITLGLLPLVCTNLHDCMVYILPVQPLQVFGW